MAERLEPAYSNYDYAIWKPIRSTQQIAAAAVYSGSVSLHSENCSRSKKAKRKSE